MIAATLQALHYHVATVTAHASSRHLDTSASPKSDQRRCSMIKFSSIQVSLVVGVMHHIRSTQQHTAESDKDLLALAKCTLCKMIAATLQKLNSYAAVVKAHAARRLDTSASANSDQRRCSMIHFSSIQLSLVVGVMLHIRCTQQHTAESKKTCLP